MTKLLAALAVLFSSHIFAINTYDVRDYTCQELKNFLASERVVRLNYRSFFGGTGVHYADRSSACAGRRRSHRTAWEPRPNSVFSADNKLCWMGYRCYKVDRNDR